MEFLLFLAACAPFALLALAAKKSDERTRRRRYGIEGSGSLTQRRKLLRMGKAQQKPNRVHSQKRSSSQTVQTPGLMYLVSNSKFDAAKIGITRGISDKDRVREHLKRGWVLEHFWGFNDFRDAEAIEGNVLSWFRYDRKVPIACSPRQMPQGGYTETVRLQDIQLAEIIAQINTVSTSCDGGIITTTSIREVLPGTYARVHGRVTATMGINGPGDRARRKVSWQRVTVTDKTGSLLLELSHGNRMLKIPRLIGSQVELVGRVEMHGKNFRMTNPEWSITNSR